MYNKRTLSQIVVMLGKASGLVMGKISSVTLKYIRESKSMKIKWSINKT